MKKKKKYRINEVNYLLWPIIILSTLIIGAIWTNTWDVTMVSSPADIQQQPQTIAPHTAITPQNLPNAQFNQSSTMTALMVQEGISQVLSAVRPSIVGISRTSTGQVPDPKGLSYIEPFNDKGDVYGSGVIIDQTGLVLTSFQTIGKETQVNVTLFGGGNRTYPANVVGADPNTDIAVLKIISHERFQPVILGNSDLIEVGDIVFAVGSPFGFSRTATMGIISSNRRKVNIEGIRYPDLIQIDASVNQGNNGGPLVNIKGEVIGINMAYYMPHSQYSGIGFAVPINDVISFVQSIRMVQ
ncbi:magnetosome protein MamE-Nter [Candidatus Magnetomorum sp. HK-1]|nr:magnetosome protein MamE-Nter [Candidatus Magnetomorum sp. HK-1]